MDSTLKSACAIIFGASAEGDMTNALLMDHWTVERHQETETAWTFWASYDIEPDACMKCGCIGKLYRHVPAFGFYGCYDCECTKCGRT